MTTSINKKEFIKLANQYNELTLKDIEQAEQKRDKYLFPYGEAIANILTKFSSTSCTLCISATKSTREIGCNRCYWMQVADGCADMYSILPCVHTTYHLIYYAKNKHELLIAFKARSKLMLSLL